MTEESKHQPDALSKRTRLISTWGGILTGVVCLLASLDHIGSNVINGPAYLGAAALAFGLIAIGLRRA